MRTLDDVQPNYYRVLDAPNKNRPQPGDLIVLKADYQQHSGRTTDAKGRTTDAKAGDLGIIIKVWVSEYFAPYSVLLVDGGSYVPMRDSDFEVIDTSLRGVVEGWIEPIKADPIDSANVASAYKFIQERMAVEPTTPAACEQKPAEQTSTITVQGRKVRVGFSGNVLRITCAECGYVLGSHYLGNLINEHQ